MLLSEVRRVLPRVASAVLVSAAVGVLSVPAAQSASPAQPSRPAARTAPTDLYRGQQWTLDALRISRAWKYSRGNGVTVAVLDTGVDGHQADLSGRVIDGPDFTGHARKPGNRFWGRHGTEMASLIAGHGHGAGAASGVMGVAPDAKILSIRVTWELNDPIRTDHAQVNRARDAVAKGIRYAADHGAQVISMSLGGGNLFYNGNAAEEAAIKYALGKGAVLVASAGNDGNAANRRNYPAAYPGVIAVGAVDRAFKAAKFTNRHTYISVAAPGVEIVSADAAGHGYILGTGTSSSAAFVAGMSALVKARYPNLTPQEVKQSLEEGATHRPPDGRSSEIGTGVVDAYGALRTAARINKAEHGGTSVERPQPTSHAAPAASKDDDPDLMLIAVLSGGGTLLLLSLILGWRQRRRRAPAREADDVPEEEEPRRAALPAAARATPDTGSWERRSSAPPQRTGQSSGQSSGLSPWERRPESSVPDEVARWDAGPPEASPPITPWERRRTAWDGSPNETAWDHRTPEAPSSARDEHPESSWDRPEASPPAWDRLPSSEPSWDQTDSSPAWDHHTPEAPSSARDEHPESSWDRPEASPPAWDHRTPEAPSPVRDEHPAPESSWDRLPSSEQSWDQAPADPSSAADRLPPSERSWDRPPPAERSWDRRPPAERPWDLPVPDDPPPAEPPAAETPSPGTPDVPDTPGTPSAPAVPFEPFEPSPRDPAESNGSGRHHAPAYEDPLPPAAPDPDPLGDGPIDSSADVGTPLADQSWDSIRRGFDRLKDASNWESLAKGELDDSGGAPAPDAFDETAALPVIDPDDKDERPPS